MSNYPDNVFEGDPRAPWNTEEPEHVCRECASFGYCGSGTACFRDVIEEAVQEGYVRCPEAVPVNGDDNACGDFSAAKGARK